MTRATVGILGFCALACFVSGYNDLALGYVAPALAAGLHVPPAALGPVFGMLGLGNVIGLLVCGPLADRYARKRVIVGAMLAGTPFVFGLAAVRSLGATAVLEFFASAALMGMMPIALAFAGEFAPAARRVTTVIFVFVGFALGTVLAGVTAAGILAHAGWQLVFIANGVLTLVAALVLAWRLPNVSHPGGRRAIPIGLLLRDGRGPITLLLWLMFFASVMFIMELNSWLTTVLTDAGVGKRASIIIASLVNLGGLFGAVAFAILYDRLRNRGFFVIAAAFACGSLLLIGAAVALGSVPLLCALILLVGVCTYGAQSTANAVAATLYPPEMRATGGAWALGIGQLSRIVGPPLIGAFISAGSSEPHILTLIAVPGFVAAAAAAGIGVLAIRATGFATPAQPGAPSGAGLASV